MTFRPEGKVLIDVENAYTEKEERDLMFTLLQLVQVNKAQHIPDVLYFLDTFCQIFLRRPHYCQIVHVTSAALFI